MLAEAGARDAGDLIRDAIRLVARAARLAAAASTTCWSTTPRSSTWPPRRWLVRSAGARLTAAGRSARGPALPGAGAATARELRELRARVAAGLPRARSGSGGRAALRAVRGASAGRRPGEAARSRSGAAPTSARRRRRWRRHRAADRARGRRARARSRCSCPRSRARARRSRSRSRSARSPTGWSARRRSSSAPRSATCSRGCGCWPTRPTPPPSCARSRGRRSSCARSTSRAARRSRAGASSTWSPALAAATESPQVPPEARERIRVFLKLYRPAMSGDRHAPGPTSTSTG